MLRLTTLDLPAYQYRINLEGAEYVIRLTFNDRAQSWYFDISTAAGDQIYRGVRIVQGWALLLRAKDARLPPGDFFLFFSPNDTDAMGRDGFKDGARLYYWTVADMIAESLSPPDVVTLIKIV